MNMPKRSCVHQERRSAFCAGVSLKICRSGEEYANAKVWKYKIMEITNVIRTRDDRRETRAFSHLHNFIFSHFHIFIILTLPWFLFYSYHRDTETQRYFSKALCLCVSVSLCLTSSSTLSLRAAQAGKCRTAGAMGLRCAPEGGERQPAPSARDSGERLSVAAT